MRIVDGNPRPITDGLIAVLAGAALALSLPPIGFWPIIFVAMPGAINAVRNCGNHLWRAGIAGFLFGFGYFIVAFHWIGFAFLVDAKTYLWMMPFAVGGLAAFMALYWAAAFTAAAMLSRRNVPAVASLPLMLAVVEWLRGYLFTGFPWAVPGLAADGMGGVLQLASLIGMPGLTYLILLWGALPLMLWRTRRTGGGRLFVPALLVLLLPASWAWGEWRKGQLVYQTVPNVSLALVQPNISQDDKWRTENAAAIFDELMTMSTGSEASGATHIIWPESAVPFLLDESKGALARIATDLKPNQTLLSGAIRREGAAAAGDERYYTSILEINESGKVEERYDKWRLVPGGEYLPLAWLLEPLGFRKVVNLPESFSAGQGPASFDLGAAGRAGLLICYEAIFPHDLVDASRRPSWLINVTNDGWFGRSVGPYQHLAQVRMRAVEQNMPVVRAANTGISAIIDGAGHFIEQSRLGEKAIIVGHLPKPGKKPLFAELGVLAAAALAIGCAVALNWSLANLRSG